MSTFSRTQNPTSLDIICWTTKICYTLKTQSFSTKKTRYCIREYYPIHLNHQEMLWTRSCSLINKKAYTNQAFKYSSHMPKSRKYYHWIVISPDPDKGKKSITSSAFSISNEAYKADFLTLHTQHKQ